MFNPLAHRVRLALFPVLILLGTLFSLPKPLTAAGPLSFAAPVELTPTGSRHNTWRDLNQDGRLDLVTGATRGVAFYLRRTDGGFDPPQVHIVNPEDPSGEVGRHVVADFNDDGYPDCLAHVGLYEHYLQNDGKGHFALFREVIETISDNSQFHQTPFDFDGDGRRDIIGQKEPNEHVFVLRNRGGFQFDRILTGIQTTISGVPDLEMVSGAFNGDRNQDLCTTLIIETDGKRSNNVYSGNGLGKFSLINILGNEYSTYGYDVGDLNNDGNADIVSNKNRGSPADGDGDAYVLIHYGNGVGGFTASEFMYDDISHGPIRTGDLDLDGWNDLVVLSYSLKFNGLIWVGYDHKMNLFINNRNGGFIRKTIPRPPGAPWWADDLQVVDFDGDTAPDILMKSASSGGDPYVFFRNLTPPRETSETAISRWTGNRTGEDANSEFHGEVNGSIQYSHGIYNEAFEFTGPGGGVRISESEELVGSPSFTVGAWVKAKAYPTSPAAPAVVYMRGSDSPVVVPLTLRLESDKRLWFRTECHTDREGISAPLTLNRWTHVAGVFDAGRRLLRLYFDGVLIAERTIAFLPSRALGDANRPANSIGNHSGYPLGPMDWPFRGVIDDVHFFDRALTPDEMGQLAGILPTSPPDAPAGLKVTTESDVSLRLSWEDRSFNEKRFEIERRDPGGSFVSLIGVPANTTSYLNSNLQPSSTYSYRVRSSNDIGASDYCPEASATTLASVWPAPSNLEASSFNARKVGLFWDDNATDETSFSLERSLDGTRFKVLKTLPANTVEIFDATTLPNTKYWYRLRGVRGTLVSSYSNVAIVTTPPDPPLAPANLSATPFAGQKIRLQWEDRSNIETRFRVERCVGDGSFQEVAQLAANTRTWSTGTLDSNRTYFFRVRAQNTGGFSAYANTAKALTFPVSIKDLVITVPAAPAGETRLDLRWTDPNFELAKVRVVREKGGSVEKEATLNAGVRTFSDTGLTPTTTYKYMVFAFNASAQAAAVSRSATTLTPPPPPPPPMVPDQLACTILTATSASLKWRDRSTDETGFEVERATAGGAFARVKSLGANVATWSDATLSPATTYAYRVRGVRGTERSDYSAEAGGTTPALPPPPPAAPASLRSTAEGLERVNLQWTDRSSNETGFRLERAVGASGSFSKIAAPTADATTYTDEAIAPATTYRYRMLAENSGGRSAYSNTASVTIERLVRGSLQVTGSLTFGVVKRRKSKTLAVTFKNVSASEKLSLNVVNLSKPFAVVSGGGEGVLEPGASRTVRVSFTPKKRKKFSATLTATTSDPQRSTVEISATGKGK